MRNAYKYEIVLKNNLQIPPPNQPFQIAAADSHQANRLAMKMMGFKVRKVRSKKQKDYKGQMVFKGI